MSKLFVQKEKTAMSKKGFWRITFDTNPNDCNLHCIMCEHHSRYSTIEQKRINAGKSKQRMNITLIESIIKASQNTALEEIIPSTMGEPLLYKDFDSIINLCKQFKIKLNLTTNGTFPVKGAKEWADLIVPIASDIKISWNGATPHTQEKIMQNSSFKAGFNNIKILISTRNRYKKLNNITPTITLQLTFMESNIDELADIIKMGIELGVDRIKGHHLWTHFSEINPQSMRRDIRAIAKWNSVIKQIKAIAETHLLPNGKAIRLDNFDELGLKATTNLMSNGVCPFLGREAWIAPDGHFSPCCAPDIQRRELGDFGNVNEHSLMEIWESSEYQDLCQNYMDYDICVKCNMRRPLKSCYASDNQGVNR